MASKRKLDLDWLSSSSSSSSLLLSEPRFKRQKTMMMMDDDQRQSHNSDHDEDKENHCDEEAAKYQLQQTQKQGPQWMSELQTVLHPLGFSDWIHKLSNHVGIVQSRDRGDRGDRDKKDDTGLLRWKQLGLLDDDVQWWQSRSADSADVRLHGYYQHSSDHCAKLVEDLQRMAEAAGLKSSDSLPIPREIPTCLVSLVCNPRTPLHQIASVCTYLAHWIRHSGALVMEMEFFAVQDAAWMLLGFLQRITVALKDTMMTTTPLAIAKPTLTRLFLVLHMMDLLLGDDDDRHNTGQPDKLPSFLVARLQFLHRPKQAALFHSYWMEVKTSVSRLYANAVAPAVATTTKPSPQTTPPTKKNAPVVTSVNDGVLLLMAILKHLETWTTLTAPFVGPAVDSMDTMDETKQGQEQQEQQQQQQHKTIPPPQAWLNVMNATPYYIEQVTVRVTAHVRHGAEGSIVSAMPTL